MKILLVEQHKNRGFESNILIAAYLERLGHDVELSFTGVQLPSNIAKFQPDLVYYPWVTETVEQYLHSRNPGVPIVNSFQEQLVLVEGNTSPRVEEEMGLTDYYFVWGEPFKKRLIEKGFPAENIYVTGHPRHDRLLNSSLVDKIVSSKKELAKRFSLPLHKSWVIFAMDFPILFQTEERKKELKKRGILSEAKFSYIKEAFDVVNRWLSRYLESHKDPLIILRPHPGTPIDKLKGIQDIKDYDNVEYIRSGSIDEWLVAADLYFTRASTSLYEAWLTQTPSFTVCSDLRPGNRNRIHLENNDEEANQYSEFEKYLTSISELKKPNQEEILEKLFFKLDGLSCYRTAKQLSEIEDQIPNKNNYTSRPLRDNMNHFQAKVKALLNETGLIDQLLFNNITNKEFLSDEEIEKRKNYYRNLINSHSEKMLDN